MTQPPCRYFAFTKKSIKGPLYPKDIAQLPGFARTTLVCPEAALGHWREAQAEEAFRSMFDFTPRTEPAVPSAPLTREAAEDRAVRSLLEKAIQKNSQLDNEVRALRQEYDREKKKFEEELGRKDLELRAFAEKAKRGAAAQLGRAEHPSWEHLYKTLKNRSDEKLFELTQTLSEKSDEVLRLKNQMQNMLDTHETSRRGLIEKTAMTRDENTDELKALRSELEEKETIVKTMADSVQSMQSKNEEFQHILLDERRDHEAQNTRFCEEIGRLKSEAKWKQQELDRANAEIADLQAKLREFESAENFKDREQDELYGVIHSKVRILTGYFENLESRLKYALKKA